MMTTPIGAVSRIPIIIGRDQWHRNVEIDLAGDAAHIMVQGKTRSGKSQLTYNVLAQCAANPAVRVVGSDPTSVLLAPFKYREPAEPKIVLGQDDSPGTLDILTWVKEESDRRISHMWDLRIDKYDCFSAAFPLIVVVLEEFPAIIDAAVDHDAASGAKPAERIAPRIQNRVRAIAAQSAKAGIRLMLLTQRAEASIVNSNTRSNIGTKFTLRVDEPESVRMLHPSASPEECALVEGFQPGKCLFEKPGSMRDLIRCDFVGKYARYASSVETSDIRFLATLQQDVAQREFLAEEYPDVEDLA